MADTFALHRGLQPQKSRRLVLVFLYSVVPSNRSPKIPFFESEKIGNDFEKDMYQVYLSSKTFNVFYSVYF